MNWFSSFFSSSPSTQTTITHYLFAEISDIGSRDYNEDRMTHYFDDSILLFLVADGLGGHESGDIAAQLICDTILQAIKQHKTALKNNLESEFKILIEGAIQNTSHALADKKIDSHSTFTCAAVHLKEQLFITAHVGDSRIYHLGDNKILWRSRDHSVVQMLLDEGEIKEDEMGQHPEQGLLTRSISSKDSIRISFSAVKKLRSQQALLLCSDGIWENLPSETIAALAGQNPGQSELQKSLNQWVDTAKKSAGKDCDNLTAQVVYFS